MKRTEFSSQHQDGDYGQLILQFLEMGHPPLVSTDPACTYLVYLHAGKTTNTHFLKQKKKFKILANATAPANH